MNGTLDQSGNSEDGKKVLDAKNILAVERGLPELLPTLPKLLHKESVYQVTNHTAGFICYVYLTKGTPKQTWYQTKAVRPQASHQPLLQNESNITYLEERVKVVI